MVADIWHMHEICPIDARRIDGFVADIRSQVKASIKFHGSNSSKYKETFTKWYYAWAVVNKERKALWSLVLVDDVWKAFAATAAGTEVDLAICYVSTMVVR